MKAGVKSPMHRPASQVRLYLKEAESLKNYIINLDRSPDRLLRLEKIFSSLNLRITRVVAVDGEKLDDATLNDVAKRNIWPDAMTRGEIACFLSHAEAIRKIRDGKEDYGAVFEDDVELSPAAEYFLNETGWIPHDADIVKIETYGKKVWLGAPHPVFSGYTIARLKGTHIMAAAYIMSKAAAARFLTHMEQISAPFDHLIFNQKLPVFDDFIIYQLDPAIVRQAKLASTLQHGRKTIDENKRKKRTLIQTLKRETKRLFTRARTGLWGLQLNVFSREQWKRIPFDK